MDFVVREGDGLSDSFRDWPRVALETFTDRGQCDIRSFTAGGLSAYAIDDQQHAARGVDMEPIFVDFPLDSRVGATRGDKRLRVHVSAAERSRANASHGRFPTRASTA